MRRILPALLLAAAAAAEPDSLGWVTGRVTDSVTGEPLVANVTALGPLRSVSTNADGVFTLELPAGRRRLEVSCYGYALTRVEVEVAAEDTLTADFALAWKPPKPVRGTIRLHSAEEVGGRGDSIRQSLATVKWDVTVVYDGLDGGLLRPADAALADSARVRALRTWKADTGTYYLRELSVHPDFGDTATANYLLVEDGRCTAVLQRWQYDQHRVINPEGAAIVYRPEEPYARGWAVWDGTPLDRPGRLRLLLQVEGQPPDDPYIF